VGFFSVPRASRTGQRAIDEAASLRPPPPDDEGEAALSGGREQRFIQAKRPAALVFAESLYLSSLSKTAIMTEINKLSVEKVLDKLRAGDAKQSKDTLFNNKIDALDEEIERMRTQRLRLEQHQRRRAKDNR
jgi:hypothetical protein